MPDEPLAARLLADNRRYFPEWADRPESCGLLLEADHNSYLAGGYSEEFGYRVRADFAPRLPLFVQDPERTEQWHVQCGGLHPGYPECPRPADREVAAAWSPERGALDPEPAVRARPASQDAPSRARARAGDAEIVPVDRRGIARSSTLLASLHSLRMRWRVRRELHRVQRVM